MNKTVKTLIFSAVALIILWGTIAVLKVTQKDPDVKQPEQSEQPAPETKPVAFTDYNAEDLISVHIKNKADEYNIEKSDNYSIKEITVPVPYSAALFDDMAASLARISSARTVELGAADLAKYGLADPKTEVYAVFKSGSVAFCIGDDSPIGPAVYFRLKDSGDVYTVNTSGLSVFEKDRYYFLERKVAPDYDSENVPEISRVLIKRYDLEQPIIIEALPELPLEESRTFNTHRMISPYSLDLEQERSKGVIYGIFGLTAKAAVWAGLEALDYELASLNEPTCYVEVQSGGKLYTLTIGAARVEKDEDGGETLTGWYGVCSEVPDVLYVFDTESLPWIYAEPEALMAQMFLTPYVYSLKELVVETPDNRIEFDISGGADDHSIAANGTILADERPFTDLYMFLIGAKGESVFTEDYESFLIARVTYRYKDETRADDVVEFYKADDRKSVIRVNGENLFKCRDVYTTRLAENISAFLSGGEIIGNW